MKLGGNPSSPISGHPLHYEPQLSLDSPGLWMCHVETGPAFQEYMEKMIALGRTQNIFAKSTQSIRKKIAELIASNPLVSSFIRVCPGVEPSVLTGKIFWEGHKGVEPGNNIRWANIVVDCPATGHFLMFFRSLDGVANAFQIGLVQGQAREILRYLSHPLLSSIHVISLCEDLPVQESLDLIENLKALGTSVANLYMNRHIVDSSMTHGEIEGFSKEWRAEISIDQDVAAYQKELLRALPARLPPNTRTILVPEVPASSPLELGRLWQMLHWDGDAIL